MRLLTEFDDERAASRAVEELKAAGFAEEELRVTHPFEGGAIVSVVASGRPLLAAFAVLRRHEGDEPALEAQNDVAGRSPGETH